MKGIYGVFYRNGRPISPQTLQKMDDTLAHWGPDGRQHWHDASIGLGHLHYLNTPESVYEKLPYHDHLHKLVITAAGRIDNRGELCDLFSIPSVERPQTPDSQLMLRAYVRWGEECPSRILGDWAFAIWNPQTQTVFLARDHHGHTSIYYYLDEQLFAFASSYEALFCLPEVPRRLNENKLAQSLARWSGDLEQTLYEDIYHLPSANTLSVTSDQQHMQAYWYPEQNRPIRYKSVNEYAEGLYDVLAQAVDCRLRSYHPISISMSGGLDSGSVGMIAAKKLAEQNSSLRSYTAVPFYQGDDLIDAPQLGRMADERAIVEAIARHAGNISTRYLASDGQSPVQASLKYLDLRIEPNNSFGNSYWLTDLYQTAHTEGKRTMLTGSVGNFTISWPGHYREQFWGQMIRQRAWKQIVKYKLLYPLTPIKWEQNRHFQRSKHLLEDHFHGLNPSFVTRVGLREQMKARNYQHTFASLPIRDPYQRRWNIIQPRRDSRLAINAHLGAGFGVDVRDPTADVRVIEYCLAIPAEAYVAPDGGSRSLIRQAMVGVLPEAARLNRLRGFQGHDLVSRLKVHGLDVESNLSIMTDEHRFVNQYIDFNQLKDEWRNLVNTKYQTIQHHAICRSLLHKLMFSNFLIRYLKGNEDGSKPNIG